MCRQAVADDQLFDCSDIETRRNTPSFTIETARELKKQGFDPVTWLIGADMFNTLPTWHDPAALLREVDFLIMARPGHRLDWQSLGPEYQFLQSSVVEVPLVPISATDIRQRVAEGRSIDGLTPPAIVDYIRTHQLYQPGSKPGAAGAR
jgi:nicotinate-nucleotide adenylyltransferase